MSAPRRHLTTLLFAASVGPLMGAFFAWRGVEALILMALWAWGLGLAREVAQ